MADIIRKHMIIHGDVQGVGFRYRAKHAANSLRITGWVRNEWDGTVEMEAQGTEEQINKMFVMISAGTYINIERVDSKLIPLEEHESGFHER